TILSKDDDTTARGWQRMNLNSVVTSNNPQAAATKIGNWIRDAWTSPTTSMKTLQNGAQGGDTSQMFGDDRLRAQIAANIVDYIDTDNTPTDMGDTAPSSGGSAVPVIGIEKIPYIHAIEIIYQASNSTYPTPTPSPNPAPGGYTATVKMKIQFRFINLFESNLGLTNQIGTITVKGVPAITKNGSTVLDVSSQTFTINATDLKPFNPPTDFNIPAGTDGASNPTLRGVRTFQTDWLVTKSVPFTVSTKGDERQRLVDGTLNVQVLGKNGERLDVMQLNLKIDKSTKNALTGYYYGSNKSNGSYSSWGDFLEDATSTNQPQLASISLPWGNGLAGTSDSVDFGDPRYRGNLITSRFENDGRTDSTSHTWTPA